MNDRKFLLKFFYVRYLKYIVAIFAVWTGILTAAFVEMILLRELVDGAVSGLFHLHVVPGLLVASMAIPLLNFLSEFINGVLVRRIQIDLTSEILRSAVRRDFDKSEVLARISSDVERAIYAAYTPMGVAFQAARFLAFLAMAMYFSVTLTLATLPLLSAYFLIAWRLGPGVYKYSAAERDAYSNVYRWVRETVEGSHSLRRLGVYKLPTPLTAAFSRWLHATKKQLLYIKGVTFGADSITATAPMLVIGLGAALATQGLATLGAAIAASRAVVNLFEPVSMAVAMAASYAQFKTSYRRVAELLDFKRATETEVGGGEAAVVKSAVFTYDDKVILSDVNLELRPGDFVWVRGPSGAGKTTLGKALAGLLKPASGVVEVPRGAIYVGNDDYIFDATVYENIDLWEGHGREEVEKAARLAAIDFPLDKNARELSEGQRQRVLIARALLRNPHLLVLDETISGLDQQTAEKVLSAIRNRVPICVVISHRPVETDKIIEIKNGKISNPKPQTPQPPQKHTPNTPHT